MFASPVYFASPNGTLISFLDRLFSLAKDDFYLKPAACLVSCRRGGATSSIDALNKYPQICSMPLVSSNYWNMVHGNTPKEVLEDKEGIQTISVLANNMTYMLKSFEAAKKAGITPPKNPEKIKTNYIR